jgi:hypothetical protein
MHRAALENAVLSTDKVAKKQENCRKQRDYADVIDLMDTVEIETVRSGGNIAYLLVSIAARQ